MKFLGKSAVSSVLLVAAVLLIGVVAVFALLILQIRPEETQVRPPGDLSPVENLIYICLDDSVERAFITLGKQGGMLYSGDAFFDPDSPTEGNALPLSKEDFVAYWHFMHSNNYCTGDCSFGSMAKPLDELKVDIEEYISYSMLGCVIERWEHGDDYRMTIKQLPNVEVLFVSNRVRVKAEFPVDVSVRGDGAVREISTFETELDLDFKKIYEAAEAIAGYQMRTRSLEQAMLNLIWMYSDTDSDALPPMYEVSLFDYSPTYWNVNYVESLLKGLMSAYLNQVSVKGSKNFREPELPDVESTVMQNFLNWDLSAKRSLIQNYDIDVFYNPAWEPFVSFFPHEGFLMPETTRFDGNPFLMLTGIVGMVKYKFNYQVSFPVLVQINDPRALGGEGYSFRLALEGNIRNNEVLEEGGGISIIAGAGSVLCNKEQWAGSYEIEVKDENSQPLEGVSLVASAIGESCGLGITDSSGRIVTALPKESVVTLEGFKQGYFVRPSLANTKHIGAKYHLNGFAEKEIEVSAEKLVFSSQDLKDRNYQAGIRQQIGSEESLLFMMQNVEDEQYFVALSPEQGEPATTSALLVPGTYEVFAIIIHEEEIVIPEEQKLLYTLDELVLEKYPLSIVNIKEGELFEITAPALYSSDTIHMLIPATEPPKSYNELESLAILQEWINEESERFMPRLR